MYLNILINTGTNKRFVAKRDRRPIVQKKHAKRNKISFQNHFSDISSNNNSCVTVFA